MGLDDFDHVVKMINTYVSYGKDCTVQIVKHPSLSKSELAEFEKIFSDIHIKLQKITYKNWSGDKFCAFAKTNCIRAKHEMTIMYNGIVNLCCMEYGKVTFDDVNHASVKEIWNSPERQRFALAHSKGEYMKGVPCSNCTLA